MLVFFQPPAKNHEPLSLRTSLIARKDTIRNGNVDRSILKFISISPIKVISPRSSVKQAIPI